MADNEKAKGMTDNEKAKGMTDNEKAKGMTDNKTVKGETANKECPCGGDNVPKIFYMDEFQIRGYECSKCGKTTLNSDDVIRYAEYKKGINVAERVVC